MSVDALLEHLWNVSVTQINCPIPDRLWPVRLVDATYPHAEDRNAIRFYEMPTQRFALYLGNSVDHQRPGLLVSDHRNVRRDLVVATGGDVRVGWDRLIAPDHVPAAGENNLCDSSQSDRLVNVVCADDVASVLALPILVS